LPEQLKFESWAMSRSGLVMMPNNLPEDGPYTLTSLLLNILRRLRGKIIRMRMRAGTAIGGVITALFGVMFARSALQTPTVRPVDENVLREYTGVYRWQSNAFVYLQLWNEFSGFDKPSQLVAFDESGDVRVLYPTDRDQFFAGPGAALPTSIESRVAFQRDGAGKVISLEWRREGGPSRGARRVEIEAHEDVRFSSGDVQLAGTLISPASRGKRPAIILVHGSGPENREYILPWARFLIRRGIAVLGYDKRGVGGSTGDWNTASFDDLAGDVVAAFEHLKTRADIDPAQIGLLGVSQAGWIMPLAAVRAKNLAFLISLSGAGVRPAETTIDQARNEMTARGMKPQTVDDIIAVMTLQYQFARTGHGWDEYASAREKLAARIGPPPDTLPETPDHPYWQSIRRTYFYEPAPTLRQLQVPVLALFGELDNNILAEKNKAAWEAALKAGGNRDHTLLIVPKANHGLFEAKVGTNAEVASLQRFVPAYFTIVQDWLGKRIRGFDTPAPR
jgi:pimeloyl-ACP methyl ester carboxylesterase